MMAPVAAPIPAPPKVPFSRVDSGSPEHPATRKSAARAKAPVTIACLRMVVLPLLFSFARTLQLLNLSLLRLELSLLRADLRLGLSILIFPILHLVADRVSAQRTDTASNSRTCQRITHSSTDNRTGCRSDAGTDERALLTGRQRLSRASHGHRNRHRHEQTFDNRYRVCPHGFLLRTVSSFHARNGGGFPGQSRTSFVFQPS